MSDEKADLEQLLTSPGWLRFEHAITEYWRQQIDPFLEGAVADADTDQALSKLRQLVAAHKAVRQALAWPRERLKRLQQPVETVTSFTRGGYDPQATR